MRLHRLSLLLPLLLAACDGGPLGGTPGDVRITAAVDEAAPPPQQNVEYQVQNLGIRTVYVLDHCGPTVTPVYQRRLGGEWVDAPYGGVPCFASITPAVELGPGDLVEGAIAIHEPGRYRMRLRVGTRPDGGVEETVYREFTVE
jgi:hypothetical protein